jgi:hypothetical protein
VKLALIAPFDMLNQSSFGQWHLMLPQLIEDMTYTKHFLALCDNPEKEVILDNGAAEDNPVSFDKLCRIALEFGVDEIVCPDVLRDPVGTFTKLGPFLDKVASYSDLTDKMPRLGYVLQGDSLEAAAWAVHRLLSSSLARYIDVWYIPRLLIRESRDRFIRLKVARHLNQVDDENRPIHFLGMDGGYPQEAKAIVASGIRNCRSLDTSLPYVYALNGQYIESEDNKPQHRPEDFFESRVHAATRIIAIDNCDTLERWVEGK